MSYAAPSDFILRVDARRLGDLGLDDGTRVSPTNLLTNPRLQASLDDASGMIDAALLRGGRYQPSDLLHLNVNTSFGNNLLIRLCVDIAYGLLLEARGYSEVETVSMAPGYTKALAMIDRLSSGEWIFGLAPVIVAGGPGKIVPLSSNVTLLTQSAATRYFGDLGYQFPPSNQPPLP